MPGPKKGKPSEKSFKEQARLLGRLYKFVIKNYTFSCIVVLVCILITAMVTLISTLFFQTLIDDYIAPLVEQAVPDYSPLASRLVVLSVILVVGVISAYGYNRIMVNVTQGTMHRLRTTMYTLMEKLPIKYFDTHPHGDVMSVYTNDIDTLRQLISQSSPQIINSAVTLVSSLVSMVVLDIPLTIISVIMLCIMFLITAKLSGKSGRYFIQQQKDLGILDGYIEEAMDGQKVVKVFCHEEKAQEKFDELNEKLRNSSKSANYIANIAMPIAVNLGNVSYVLCAIVGGILAINGFSGLTIGTLVTFLTLNKSLTRPVTTVSQQVSAIVMAAAGCDRVFDLMDQKAEEDDGYVELVNVREDENGNLTETEEATGEWAWKDPEADGMQKLRKLEGGIRFKNVDFGYTDEKMVLHDINMYAAPGQKIALVGSTGAGKTTITNLINRFYDIQEGEIFYDRIELTKIKKSALRFSLKGVLQDTKLFTGTIMENIRYGRLDATDEECIAAAKLAYADGFIQKLPDKYQTMLVNGGTNISQGQRQLLAIARAAVGNPPLLILDEATSSIDTRAEKYVQKGMDALMGGRTSFVIAHRLSTIKDADCIMVMEQGRIIERGSHDELLEQKGRYYQLYTGKKAEKA